MVVDLDSSEEIQELDLLKREAQRNAFSSFRVELILRAYIAMGILMALCALGYFGFSFLDIDLTDVQRMSLAVAGIGAAIAAMSATMLAFRRQQNELRSASYEIVEAGYDVVREWTKFEVISRQVLSEKGLVFNTRSPRSIVNMLESNGVISNELTQELSLALDVRNRVVHDAQPVPQSAVRHASQILARANEVLSLKLRDLEKNPEGSPSTKLLKRGRRQIQLDND